MERVMFTDDAERTALTREDIVSAWEHSLSNFKEALCCPGCRDILQKNSEGKYYCPNTLCLITKE